MVTKFIIVIPAQAGIHWTLVIAGRQMRRMDSRLRGNDEIMGLINYLESSLIRSTTLSLEICWQRDGHCFAEPCQIT